MLLRLVGAVGRLSRRSVAAPRHSAAAAAAAAATKEESLVDDSLLGGIANRKIRGKGNRPARDHDFSSIDWRRLASTTKELKLGRLTVWPQSLAEALRRRVEECWSSDAASILKTADVDDLALFVAVVSRRPRQISEDQWRRVARRLCGASLTRRQALFNLRAFLLFEGKMKRGRPLTDDDKLLIEHLYRSVQSSSLSEAASSASDSFWSETYWRALDACYADPALRLQLFSGSGDLALTLARLPIDLRWFPSERDLINHVLPLFARLSTIGAKSAALYLYAFGDVAYKLGFQISAVDKERLRPLVQSMCSADELSGVNSLILCSAVLHCSRWGLDSDALWSAVEQHMQADKAQQLRPHIYMLQEAKRLSLRSSQSTRPISTETWQALVDRSPATTESLDQAASLVQCGATSVKTVVGQITSTAMSKWSKLLMANEIEAPDVCDVLANLTRLQVDTPQEIFTYILSDSLDWSLCSGVQLCNIVEALAFKRVLPGSKWWSQFIKHFSVDMEVSRPLLYALASNTFVFVNMAHMEPSEAGRRGRHSSEPAFLLPAHLYDTLLDRISTPKDATRALQLFSGQQITTERDVLASVWQRFEPAADPRARPYFFGLLYNCVKLGYCPDGLRSSHLNCLINHEDTVGLPNLLNLFAMLEVVFGVKIEPQQWAAVLARVDGELEDMSGPLYRTLLKCRIVMEDDALLPEGLRARLADKERSSTDLEKMAPRKTNSHDLASLIRKSASDEASVCAPWVVERLNFTADAKVQLEDGGEELWLNARTSMRCYDLASRTRTGLNSQARLWDGLLRSLGYRLRYFDGRALEKDGELQEVNV